VGKGFRIIANEIRALAGQTGDFAKTIETTINDFESVVGQITDELREFSRTSSLSNSPFHRFLTVIRPMLSQ